MAEVVEPEMEVPAPNAPEVGTMEASAHLMPEPAATSPRTAELLEPAAAGSGDDSAQRAAEVAEQHASQPDEDVAPSMNSVRKAWEAAAAGAPPILPEALTSPRGNTPRTEKALAPPFYAACPPRSSSQGSPSASAHATLVEEPATAVELEEPQAVPSAPVQEDEVFVSTSPAAAAPIDEAADHPLPGDVEVDAKCNSQDVTEKSADDLPSPLSGKSAEPAVTERVDCEGKGGVEEQVVQEAPMPDARIEADTYLEKAEDSADAGDKEDDASLTDGVKPDVVPREVQAESLKDDLRTQESEDAKEVVHPDAAENDDAMQSEQADDQAVKEVQLPNHESKVDEVEAFATEGPALSTHVAEDTTTSRPESAVEREDVVAAQPAEDAKEAEEPTEETAECEAVDDEALATEAEQKEPSSMAEVVQACEEESNAEAENAELTCKEAASVDPAYKVGEADTEPANRQDEAEEGVQSKEGKEATEVQSPLEAASAENADAAALKADEGLAEAGHQDDLETVDTRRHDEVPELARDEEIEEIVEDVDQPDFDADADYVEAAAPELHDDGAGSNSNEEPSTGDQPAHEVVTLLTDAKVREERDDLLLDRSPIEGKEDSRRQALAAPMAVQAMEGASDAASASSGSASTWTRRIQDRQRGAGAGSAKAAGALAVKQPGSDKDGDSVCDIDDALQQRQNRAHAGSSSLPSNAAADPARQPRHPGAEVQGTFRIQVPKEYPGVHYRRSKALEDKHPLHVPSGFVVEGFIEDDGEWLRVEDASRGPLYLPFRVGTVHVLHRTQSKEQAPHMSRDRPAYAAQQTPMVVAVDGGPTSARSTAAAPAAAPAAAAPRLQRQKDTEWDPFLEEALPHERTWNIFCCTATPSGTRQDAAQTSGERSQQARRQEPPKKSWWANLLC